MKIRFLTLLIGAAFSFPVSATQDSSPEVVGLSDMQTDDSLNTTADDGVSGAESSGSGVLKGARFTLTQELAARILHPHGAPNNRTSFRVEYEKHFLDNFYLHFDVIETAFLGSDHRAKARGDSVFAEATVRDGFLQFSKANTSVKVGKQILIWGESDAGAITDVISPRNVSELFFISLEKSRISQFMVTVDQFSSIGDWSMFYIPKAKFNKYAERGDIYYVDAFAGAAELRVSDERNFPEYGLRWKRTFGRSDFSLMAARLIDNDYAMHQEGFAIDGRMIVKGEPHRFNMVGGTFNLAGEGFLVTGEVARKTPVAFLNSETLQIEKRSVLDTSLKVEYSLGKGGNHSVSLEATNRHVMDWDGRVMPTPRNMNTMVLGWRNTFLNENLTVDWLTVYNTTYTSFTHSLFMGYKLNDRVSLNLDAFYLNVKSRNNDLYVFHGQNNAIARVSYQF